MQAVLSIGFDSLYREINGIARDLERVLHAGTTLGERSAVLWLLVQQQQQQHTESWAIKGQNKLNGHKLGF